MCKPSCCTTKSSGGLGTLLAVIAVAIFLALIARPLIHGAEILLKVLAHNIMLRAAQRVST